MEDLRVFPIHKHNKYAYRCAKLLNSEWPRTVTARLTSLELSCDSLPTSLVMVYTYCPLDEREPKDNETEDVEICGCCDECQDIISLEDERFAPTFCCSNCIKNREEVVGHSKISRLLCVEDGCLIESVLIHKDYRGRGWGKYLMEQTELFIKNLGGINAVYLTTIDKQSFYRKVGYKDTDPIPLFGNSVFSSWSINTAFKSLFLSSDASSQTSRAVSRTDSTPVQPGESKPKPATAIVSAGVKVGKPAAAVAQNDQDGSAPVIPQPPPMPTATRPKKKRRVKKAKVKGKTFMVKIFK